MARAATDMGTGTKKDTVHAALRRSAARNLRAMMAGETDGPAHETTVNAMWEAGDRTQTA